MMSPVRWTKPRAKVLTGGVFPRGRPPFDPFPTITQVAKGYCPVALYWDVLWGRTPLGSEDSEGPQGLGVQYHYAVGRFRQEISRKQIILPPGASTSIIESIARDFLRRYIHDNPVPQATYENLVRVFLTYVRRKFREGELTALPDQELFIEIDVINPDGIYEYNDGRYSYPIRARLDEFNLTNLKVIERTIDRDNERFRPPDQKFLQAWLCANALRTLQRSHWPKNWGNLFRIEAVVETPEVDFPVNDDPCFHSQALNAYFWIREIYRWGPGMGTSPWDDKACTFEDPKTDCPHYFRDCWHGDRMYPRSRPAARQALGRYARHLLYDQVWQGDLIYYMLSLRSEDELLQEERLYRGQIVNIDKNSITVDIAPPPIRTRLGLGQRLVAIPMGNFFAGPRISCSIKEVKKVSKAHRIVLILSRGSRGLPIYGGTLLIYRGAIADIYEEPPTFLNEITRSDLLSSLRMGTDAEAEARASGLIELMEGSFGTIPLETFYLATDT